MARLRATLRILKCKCEVATDVQIHCCCTDFAQEVSEVGLDLDIDVNGSYRQRPAWLRRGGNPYVGLMGC